ncbi:MAG: LCP family protein [Anaerolineales bacterium]|nr:LCP family protein [Anaerolineales bacterium]
MKFDRNLRPSNHALPRIVWIVVGIWILMLCVLAALAARSTFALLAQAMVSTPTAAVNVIILPTPIWQPAITDTPFPSPTMAASATFVRLPTAEPSISREPTATRYYIIPAQPTPVPTPVLPAAAPFPTSCDGPGRMNILLIGIDGANNGYYRAARADTIILVGVNFAAKSASMLSIPRDLWVQLPDLVQAPEGRINTAYHYGELFGAPGGGPGQVSAVLANTLGLRVDRFVVVSFAAFEQGIDTIGGVDISIPNPIHDDEYPLRDGTGTIAIDFPAGEVHMDGATALIYARIRHDSSDFQRMRRQQQVLFAVRNKLLSPQTISQLPALVQTLVTSARTDLSFEDLALLGCLGPQIDASAVQTWVVEGNMVENTRLADGAQVLLPNMNAIVPVLEQFNVGE